MYVDTRRKSVQIKNKTTHSSIFIFSFDPPPFFCLRDVDACWVPLEEI